MGRPVELTTSVFLPLMTTDPLTLLSVGPMCAMRCAYTGASRHIATSTRKSAPDASATLLRRSRRAASRYGPTPATGGPPGDSTAIWSACASAPRIVPGSAIPVAELSAPAPRPDWAGCDAIDGDCGAGARARSANVLRRALLQLQARDVVAVRRVEDRRPEVELVREELRHELG